MTLPARYSTPAADAAFSLSSKHAWWTEITDAYAHTYIDQREFPEADELHKMLVDTNGPSVEMVAEYEFLAGHDVVSFLEAYCAKLPEPVRHCIHVGLTSSDLVEYGLFQALAEHTGGVLDRLIDLRASLPTRTTKRIRAGRTHGQIAEHTDYRHQMNVHADAICQVEDELSDIVHSSLFVIKTPGPSGWLGADLNRAARGRTVAGAVGCTMVSSTQVIHRDCLLRWACAYLRAACILENLALQVRLGARADVAEVKEGSERIGSSSMPHKENPIDSEKVCGLARVARGHFLAISESVALWEDRDLSQSCVERIAVPGLAATVEHMLDTMCKVMANLVVDTHRMQAGAASPRTQTALFQTVAQEVFRISPIEAAVLVRLAIADYPEYPGTWRQAVSDAADRAGYNVSGWEHEVERRLKARFE